MKHKLILASASKARLGVLKSAGITPKVSVSNIDEQKILSNLTDANFDPKLQVELLALSKALSIMKIIHNELLTKFLSKTSEIHTHNIYENEIALVACDSMLEFEGQMLGKPLDKQIAETRAKKMRGKTTILHTGHVLIKIDPNKIINNCDYDSFTIPNIATINDLNIFAKNLPFPIAMNCTSTKVTFANTSDKQIKAYIQTEEPLYVAGGFTIDGYGSAFIESIEGDYNNVIGISPNIIRKLCNEINIEYTELWDK